MPKKRDGPETKKSRKSSSASKDPSSSPMGSSDILPPPTPAASHLVATNPFDDTVPSNSMKMMHNFPNQPMMRIGRGMGPGFPSWGQDPRSAMRPQYTGPGGPAWGSNMHGNPNMAPIPGYNPSMPHNGYGHYPGPGLSSSYRGTSRMAISSLRPGMGPMGSPDGDMMMHDPSAMGPGHLVSSGNQGHMLQNTGQMKVLTRPTSQMPSPNIRKSSTSSNKLFGDSKSPKSSDTALTKRKKAEKKLNQESKSKSSENEKLNSGNDCGIPPHAILLKESQLCQHCSKNIDHTVEDTIRCLASCNKWFHRTCVGLTEHAFSLLKSEELAIWVCDGCLHAKEIQSIRPRVPLIDGQVASA